jgi:mycothiol synthase
MMVREHAGTGEPSAPGTWRRPVAGDLAAIIDLARACLAADGGLPLGAETEYVTTHFLPEPPGVAMAAIGPDGSILACGAALPPVAREAWQATLVTQVHPQHRHGGIGGALLSWTMEEGTRLLDDRPVDRAHVLRVTSETLSDGAEHLLERHGFAAHYLAHVLERDLDGSCADAPVPEGVCLAAWDGTNADQFFRAYSAAYGDRPSFPGWSLEDWLDWLEPEDEMFLPGASLIALHEEEPLGFVACARIFEDCPEIGWIVQVGVRPEWRRRGLGAALMAEAMSCAGKLGIQHVMLDAATGNAPALALYDALGFRRVGRRGHFTKEIR